MNFHAPKPLSGTDWDEVTFADTSRAFLDAGFRPTDLLPIIPHDAKLGKGTNVDQSQRGKIPGYHKSDGTWVGLSNWPSGLSPELQEKARDWPTQNVGLLGADFPAVDVDVKSEQMRDLVEEIALKYLGPSPVRVRKNSPRVLLPYRLSGDEPIHKTGSVFELGGQKHTVEVLGRGQQYVIAGIHPSGVPYGWRPEFDLRDWGADGLTAISAEKVCAFFDALEQRLQEEGATIVSRSAVTSGSGGERRAVADLEPVLSPDMALDALRAVPNTSETLPDRKDLVAVLASFKAALGRDAEGYREDAHDWATEKGWAATEYFDQVWDSLTHVELGPEHLLTRARKAGWRGDAKDAFPDPAPTIHTDTKDVGALETSLQEMNNKYAAVRLGSDVRVVETGTGGAPISGFMKTQAFLTWEKSKIRVDGKRPISLAKEWLEWEGRRSYDGAALYPLAPDGSGPPPPKNSFNTWRGFITEPAPVNEKSGWPIIQEYLLSVICGWDDRLYKYLFNWLAHLVQKPYEKPGTALVFKGEQGSGKTTIEALFKALLHEVHVISLGSERGLLGNFNAHLADALVIVANEALFGPSPKIKDALKTLVTDQDQMVERKGIDMSKAATYWRLVVTSNHEMPVSVESDARRWVPFDVSPHRAGDTSYFRTLRKALEPNSSELRALMRDLLNHQVDERAVRTPPVTSGLTRLMASSLAGAQKWLFERLAGSTPATKGTSAKSPSSGFGDDYSRDDAPEWPEFVTLTGLRSDFQNWANGERYHVPTNDRELHRLLTAVFGENWQSRPIIRGARVQVVHLGSLQEARSAFAKLYLRGTFDWEAWQK